LPHSARPRPTPHRPPERSVAERLEDLEAYVNNGARNASTNAPSKIAGPGPGHNGWMMTSAALVLFMTLPGLALFYGGLVRRKNVLSVLAQCLGIAGLVNHPVVGLRLQHRLSWRQTLLGLPGVGLSQRRGFQPQHRLRGLGVAQRILDVSIDVRHHHPGADIGAIAERMKFSAILLFVTLWMFVVYFRWRTWCGGWTE